MKTALSLIHQAYEEGWEELDLSGMELTELPPENDRKFKFIQSNQFSIVKPVKC